MDGSEELPRFVSDFQRIHKKYHKLKCQCPEAERLTKEYENAKKMFDKLKYEFSQHKMKNSFDFANLADFNERLMHISLDFEKDELAFREDIWHQRISLLIKEMKEPSHSGMKISSE